MSEHRIAVVIPTFDNPDTVRDVVERVSRHVPDVFVVDDGSGEATRAVVEKIGRDRLARVHHRPVNGGKGAACIDGFELALRSGFTHALQVDADGQHDLDDIPRFVELSKAVPEALVTGRPVFGADVPFGRKHGRKLSNFFCHVETLGRVVDDPMCGFRIYPLSGGRWRECGPRMEFDVEVAVRMVWDGTPVINVPTHVLYPEGGVSHFRLFIDNVRVTAVHTRMCLRTIARWPTIRRSRGRRLDLGDLSPG